jgi:hypothetical protein
MSRVMIDTTHDGLPVALPAINTLVKGDIVALYDTGSPSIAATVSDFKEINADLEVVLIDQGFTGSPNMKANVRDVETGAWLIAKAVNKAGWNVTRPTLYLGFPETAQKAFDAGWRGDVWLVMPSSVAPVKPPVVPEGLNVVAVQWNFKDPSFDVSTVFDPTWPEATVTTPPPPGVQSGWHWCNKCSGLFFSHGANHCPAGGEHDSTGSYNYSLSYE